MDVSRRQKIADYYSRAFESYIAPAIDAAKDPAYPEAKRRNIKAAIYLGELLHEVPVHLFVAGWTRRGAPQTQALFPAIQNILLACRAVGIGASLTAAHRAFGDEVDELLGLTAEIPSSALIPIGWPKGRYGHPPRNSIDECFFVKQVGG